MPATRKIGIDQLTVEPRSSLNRAPALLKVSRWPFRLQRMEVVDVAIVGGGPAGSTCAAFCAKAGLRTLVIEREKFPREKVCGDCLNPSCWAVLEHLGVAQRVRDLRHSKLDSVEFIAIDGHNVVVDLPTGDS